MSGTINFGGLASGLDTDAIIEAMVEVRKTAILDPITEKKDTLTEKKTQLELIQSTLQDLRDAAKKLYDPLDKLWGGKTGSSSDETSISFNSTSSSAIAGSYVISDVSQLAQADRVIFNGVADKDSSNYGSGTVSITYKGTTTSFEIDSTMSLEDISDTINAEEMGVTASIVNDGGATPYRLVLTADDTGSDTTITHNINSILSLTVDSAASSSAENEGADASFKVNGISVTSASNIIEDVIEGVSFTLNEENTTSSTTISISKDTDSIETAISNLVDQFNVAKEAIKTAISYDVENEEYGPLGHDLTLSSASTRIESTLIDYVQELSGYDIKSLADIGITTNTDGEMELDTEILSSALSSDLTNVKLLFKGNDTFDGIAENVYNFLDELASTGGTMDDNMDNIAEDILDLEAAYTSKEESISDYEDYLSVKFAAMEAAIESLKSTQTAIDSFISAFENSGN